MSRTVAIIPSRLESTRVQQKSLVQIADIPMVVHVYQRALQSPIVDEVWVATDSEEIKSTVERYGGKAVLTGAHHKNGTERLAEAAADPLIGIAEDEYVILVNGDEALLNPDYIEVSYQALINSDAQASILANPFYKNDSPSDFKVVLNLKNEVMYISRGDVPCAARNPVKHRLKAYHIMTFKRQFLDVYASLEKTPMESIEDHEHLRIIENGYKLQAAIVDSSVVSVDTEHDLAFVRDQMPGDPHFQL